MLAEAGLGAVRRLARARLLRSLPADQAQISRCALLGETKTTFELMSLDSRGDALRRTDSGASHEPHPARAGDRVQTKSDEAQCHNPEQKRPERLAQ